MYERAAQVDRNVVSQCALMIGGTLGISVPLTLLIIWICA